MPRTLTRSTARRLAAALLWAGLAACVGAGGLLWYLATSAPSDEPPQAEEAPGTASVKLAWDPSPSDRVVGYKVLYGDLPGKYTGSKDVPKVTTATLSGLRRGIRYYIVVVALDAHGNRSPPSNEVEVTPK
jgi:hypothetical protein